MWAVDDLSTGRLDHLEGVRRHERLRLNVDSILNRPMTNESVARVDQVVHLAAAVRVRKVIDERVHTITTDVRGTGIVLDGCDRHRKPPFIASTSESYGKGRPALRGVRSRHGGHDAPLQHRGPAADRGVVRRPGAAGRARRRLGHRVVARLNVALRRRVPTASAIVVGAGEREQALKALATSLGFEGAVRWLGWRRDLPELYSALDAVALTSHHEGTPVALLEALAAAALEEELRRPPVEDAVRARVAQRWSVARLVDDLSALYRRELARR